MLIDSMDTVVTGFIQKQNPEPENQLLIKETNLKRLFHLIYNHQEISRAELATLTKLSPTTVSVLVEELISSGLVYMSGIGKTNKIGRKPVMLKINGERLQIPTIAWERTGFRYVLFDLLCNELESFFTPHDELVDYAEELHHLITQESKHLDETKLGAMCLSIPAVVDPVTKRIVSTVLDVTDNDDFLIKINGKFPNVPIIIGNESAFYAYAENVFVLSIRAQNLIYINVNDGVGVGIIHEGDIYRGSFGMAGEFGHMSIDMNGPLCSCGNRGCIERLISIPRIIENITIELENGNHSAIETYCGGNYGIISLDMVARAFQATDLLVTEILKKTALQLSFGINNLVRIFDPETIVIGGGIELFGPDFLEIVKDLVNRQGEMKLPNEVDIRYTELPPAFKNKGAARYYIDNVMRFTVNRDRDVIVC